MKTLYISLILLLITVRAFTQDTITAAQQEVRVDTVVIERVRVDTVYVQEQTPVQEQSNKPKENQAKSDTKGSKVYKGGYANFSFGNYTVIGIEPLIAYKLLPKFSVGAKMSYEYVKNKNYSPTREGSNYGIGAFSRLRFAKRMYAHIEYAEMNYKLYNSDGNSYRRWISYLFLGGGISLPISKSVSLNAEILWDLLQDENSPYSTIEPFINVGIVAGF